MLLKNSPEFQQLKSIKKYAAALGRYSKCTIEEFIYAYNHNGLKGKEAFDSLMKLLSPDMIGGETQAIVVNDNTVFPNSFDPSAPLGEEYKRMITEMLSYFNLTSVVPKNAKRATICDLYFNQHLTPKEIQQTTHISLPTIIDNFLTPLFRKGAADEISLNPEFKTAIDQCLALALYFPAEKLQEQLQLDDNDFSQFLYLFNCAVYEDLKNGQAAIIIHRGESSKVSDCLTKLYSTLDDELLPISKKDLYIKLEGIIDQEKILPEYIDNVIITHKSIETDSDGLIYLKDEALNGVISRISRIVYNSTSHTARKDDIIKIYKSKYGGEEPIFRQEALKERGIFSISHGGVYQYSENGAKPITVHEFIDKYIAENILFRWSELLVKIKEINPALLEGSEKSYTMKSCSSCVTDSDILVLKGHEDDYPQYQWKAPNKKDRKNSIIKKAVEILKAQQDCQMPYSLFLGQLNSYITSMGWSDHTTGSVINEFTDNDPKLFTKTDGNIKLNEEVLEETPLEYIGKGYKNAESYISIYALAVSVLKSKTDHKMLRSELTKLASSQLSEDIDGRIVNKAFQDKLRPKILYVEGDRKDAYVCLDIDIFKKETDAEQQYKVDDNRSVDSQNDTAPSLVVDTTPRPAATYRQIFNWTDIISMLKSELRYYEKPYFYPGITSDDVLEKFQRFMSQSRNIYLNQLIPQAYYELNYANVDRWSSYDYRSKIARAFESLLMDIYYQNRGVEPQTHGLREIMDLAFPDYLNAKNSHDRTGFYGILNDIYSDRNRFAHAGTNDLPAMSINIKCFISYMALYVYTVARYYKG